MRSIVTLLACAASLGAGCSWTFDSDAPELPLVGSPPELDTLQKLNHGPVSESDIVYGSDGAYWLSLQESPKELRVVRLSPASDAQQLVDGDKFLVTYRTFYTWINGTPPSDATLPTPATLSLTSAGDTVKPTTFDFPLGIGSLVIGGVDDIFAYSAPEGLSTTYDLVRKDGSFRRSVTLPGGPSTADLGGTFFDNDGSYFFDRAACASGCRTDPDDQDLGGTELRSLVAHSTLTESDIDLGLQPRRIILYEPSASQRQFVTCGATGLNIVPIVAGSANPPRMLDPDPCTSEVFSLLRVSGDGGSRILLFYTIGTELRRVPIDGSSAPEKALDYDAARTLAIYDENDIIYSRDPDSKYIYGVGDGWLNGWRFMNRGRVAGFSRDMTRMRWLENAAQAGGIGDLEVAPIGGAVTHLARNVYQYDELDDGRVLAAANHAFRGTQNRIIVIDEKKKESRWVVDQAATYSFIPNSTDLLVQVVTGPDTSDLMRVPLPVVEGADAGAQ